MELPLPCTWMLDAVSVNTVCVKGWMASGRQDVSGPSHSAPGAIHDLGLRYGPAACDPRAIRYT